MSLENCSNEHNIDFIAKSFFIFMISISFVNDIYSIKETIFSNEYIKENINKLSDISDIFKKFLSNKEKKTKDGFIIKNNDIIQKKDLSKNTKNMNNKNNTENISNEKSLNNINNIQENNLSNLEEIKPLEIISDTVIKKKKKVYNNDLMEEVQQVQESKEVKEVKEVQEAKELKVKKKDSKQLNNKKKEDINKEIVED